MKYQHVADVFVEFYSYETYVKGVRRDWTALPYINI